MKQEDLPVGGMVVGEPEKRRSSPLHTVLEVVGTVVAAIAIAMVVQFFVMKLFTIHRPLNQWSGL